MLPSPTCNMGLSTYNYIIIFIIGEPIRTYITAQSHLSLTPSNVLYLMRQNSKPANLHVAPFYRMCLSIESLLQCAALRNTICTIVLIWCGLKALLSVITIMLYPVTH